jgi:hypothetical protein
MPSVAHTTVCEGKERAREEGKRGENYVLQSRVLSERNVTVFSIGVDFFTGR